MSILCPIKKTNYVCVDQRVQKTSQKHDFFYQFFFFKKVQVLDKISRSKTLCLFLHNEVNKYFLEHQEHQKKYVRPLFFSKCENQEFHQNEMYKRWLFWETSHKISTKLKLKKRRRTKVPKWCQVTCKPISVVVRGSCGARKKIL